MSEPQEERHELTVRREHSSYSGPIPPSEEMARYEDIQPGASDRLISMAEREQSDIVSFRNRVLLATTILSVITIVAIAYIVSLNAYAAVVVALAVAQALPAITNFLRGISENRMASREHELDLQIRRDRHELEMKAARGQLGLPPGSDASSDSTPQRLALEDPDKGEDATSHRA